jgi:hypothetical protein
MISANRDNDFAGYIPFNAGSTILASASMSCSCGVAHLTSDCSALGLVLQRKEETIYNKKSVFEWMINPPKEWDSPKNSSINHYMIIIHFFQSTNSVCRIG